LKTTGSTQSGLASTFVTKLDKPDMTKTPDKGCGHAAKPKNESKNKDSKEKPKPKHNISKDKCFNCGRKGHIAPNCPEKDKEEVEEKKKQFIT
jgi:hypothetical protein